MFATDVFALKCAQRDLPRDVDSLNLCLGNYTWLTLNLVVLIPCLTGLLSPSMGWRRNRLTGNNDSNVLITFPVSSRTGNLFAS